MNPNPYVQTPPERTRGLRTSRWLPAVLALATAIALQHTTRAAEPPLISPFGRAPSLREDAIAGYVELSDGTVHPGHLYLTREVRLKIYDEKSARQREVPLRAVKQIECTVKRQWMEKEWKFREPASDEKMFTGRSYPVREYLHKITLHDGRTITGPLSAIVYVQAQTYVPEQLGVYRQVPDVEQFVLHKRAKGKIGTELESLPYVKLVRLGDEALAEGRQKAAGQRRK